MRRGHLWLSLVAIAVPLALGADRCPHSPKWWNLYGTWHEAAELDLRYSHPIKTDCPGQTNFSPIRLWFYGVPQYVGALGPTNFAAPMYLYPDSANGAATSTIFWVLPTQGTAFYFFSSSWQTWAGDYLTISPSFADGFYRAGQYDVVQTKDGCANRWEQVGLLETSCPFGPPGCTQDQTNIWIPRTVNDALDPCFWFPNLCTVEATTPICDEDGCYFACADPPYDMIGSDKCCSCPVVAP